MKKAKNAVILLLAMLLVLVSACSAAPRGNAKGSQTSGDGQTNVTVGKDGTGSTPPKNETGGTKTGKEKKTVVFSTFFPDAFFQKAKQLYEAKHPDITIDLQYTNVEDAQLEASLEKFVKTTNTAMLSGRGPDLIEMDQLPSEDYVRKKLLVNLGDLIDQDPGFRKEQYFGNILDELRVNGGLYGMPIGFFVYGLVGNETLIGKSGVTIDDGSWSWSQFADMAKELVKKTGGNQPALGGRFPEYVVTQLVNSQYAAFVDREKGEARFESAAFVDLLKEVKMLFDKNVMSEQAGMSIFWETQINSPADYVREVKQSEFYPDNQAFKSRLFFKPNASGQPAGGFFRTYKTIGLNAKSAVKEEAWNFIAFMLSDEMQDQTSGAGFPINKSSYGKVVQDVLKKGKVESDQPIGPLKGKIYDITQKDIDDLERFLTGAKYPVQFKPSKIDEIIREESKSYFTGQKSPEAVAKLIQNRVTTVLNE